MTYRSKAILWGTNEACCEVRTINEGHTERFWSGGVGESMSKERGEGIESFVLESFSSCLGEQGQVKEEDCGKPL